MRKGRHDITKWNEEPSLLQVFFRYTGLNIFAALGVSCYVLADTFFIANGIGSLGLTALNIALPIYNLINGLGLMCGIGASSAWCIAAARDESDTETTNGIYSASVVIGLLIGIVFLFAGQFACKPIASLLGADAQTIAMTATYLRVLMSFAPFFMLQNVFICFIRAIGFPSIAMTATIAGCLFNIVMDYIFIFPCRMGIFGAALATGGSPFVGILIGCICLLKQKKKVRFIGLKGLSDFRARIMELLRFGGAAFINEFSSGLVIFIYNLMILRISGNIGVAAYGIVANLAIVIMAIFTGITQGMSPLCSTAYGKNDAPAMKKLLRYGILLSLVISAVTYLVALFWNVQMAAWFNNSGDKLLAGLAQTGILLYFIGFFPAGINMVISAHAAAVAKTKAAAIITLLRGLILITAFTICLGLLFGMTGVWLSFAVTEFVTLCTVPMLGLHRPHDHEDSSRTV